MSGKKIFLVSFFVFLFCKASFAARPLATDDAGTVEKKHWEIEFGTTYSKIIERDREVLEIEIEETGDIVSQELETKNVIKETDLELVVKYGILDNFDIGVKVPYIFLDMPEDQKNIDGRGDAEVVTKYRIFEEKKILPAYTFGVALKTHTGNKDRGLGTGKIDWFLNNIFTKSIGKFILHSNIGWTFINKGKPKEDTRPDDVLFYGLAAEYPLIEEKLNLVAEFIVETEFRGNFDENPSEMLFGFNYSINKNIKFDVGAGFGLTKVSPDWKLTSGFTFSF